MGGRRRSGINPRSGRPGRNLSILTRPAGRLAQQGKRVSLSWRECGLRGRTAGKREETKSVSSLLSITHFPFRARFARKVRNGRWKEGLTFARAARPEGGGGDSQEAGGTLVPPPLVCLRRIAVNMQLSTSICETRVQRASGRALRASTGYERRMARRAQRPLRGAFLLPFAANPC